MSKATHGLSPAVTVSKLDPPTGPARPCAPPTRRPGGWSAPARATARRPVRVLPRRRPPPLRRRRDAGRPRRRRGRPRPASRLTAPRPAPAPSWPARACSTRASGWSRRPAGGWSLGVDARRPRLPQHRPRPPLATRRPPAGRTGAARREVALGLAADRRAIEAGRYYAITHAGRAALLAAGGVMASTARKRRAAPPRPGARRLRAVHRRPPRPPRLASAGVGHRAGGGGPLRRGRRLVHRGVHAAGVGGEAAPPHRHRLACLAGRRPRGHPGRVSHLSSGTRAAPRGRPFCFPQKEIIGIIC